MKTIIADTYDLYVHNSKNTVFPKKYRSYKIIWNMREALLELWAGKITVLAIPELGTPGYDFEGFIEDMASIGQIENKPKIEYYKFEIVRKNST